MGRSRQTRLSHPVPDFEDRAMDLGREAFDRGLRSPASDANMMALLREINPTGLVGNPKTLATLRAWHRGNTIAALNWSNTQ